MVPWARNWMFGSLLASASNTSMKVRPMILRFFSGSASPSRLPRNCASASARITLTPMFSANMAITWSPSCRRSRPLSTNTQVSWSPIALCSSAATTDESTPPERPSSTLASPTWHAPGRWRPRRCSTGSTVLRSRRFQDEARQDAAALAGVGHFRVELHTVIAAGIVAHGGDRAAWGAGRDMEAAESR